MKLGTKLSISYVGIVVIAVGLVLFLIIENAQREIREKIGTDLQYVSELAAKDIEDYVETRVVKLDAISQASAFRSGDVAAAEKSLRKIVQKDPGYTDIGFVDLEAKFIATSGVTDFVSKEEIGGIIRDLKLLSGEEVFALYGADVVTGKLNLFLFAPVEIRGGDDYVGVLVARLNLDYILREVGVDEQVVISGKRAYLVNGSGEIIVTQEGVAQVFTPLVYLQESSPLRTSYNKNKIGYTKYRDAAGASIIAGYADINFRNVVRSGNWSVISIAPQKEIFSPAIRLRNKVMLLGGISILIAWIIAFFVARGIVRPVRRLVRVTDMIAGGDLSQRASVRSNDEVGDLGRSFNDMTDKLNDAIATRDQEIIERMNIGEKLREEMEAKANFVSMVTHEFRTPLTAVREGIGIVLDGLVGDTNKKQKDLLAMAKNSVDSLNLLVTEMLNYHKIENDRVKFHFNDNDIHAVIAKVRDVMAPLLAEKREIEFAVKVEKKLPSANFDFEKISLVLTNLVNFVIEITQKGTITIKSAREGKNAVLVSVTSTGADLKKANITAISKLLQIEDDQEKSFTATGEGTRLGLGISKEIVDRHNGKMWVESNRAKEITFTFILPLSERRRKRR